MLDVFTLVNPAQGIIHLIGGLVTLIQFAMESLLQKIVQRFRTILQILYLARGLLLIHLLLFPGKREATGYCLIDD